MDDNFLFALFLGFVWGCIWAMVLQWTRLGRFLVHQRTWITVVIGVGIDLAIVGLCVSFEVWVRFAAVVAVSGIGIIARSLINEWSDVQELGRVIGGDKDEIGK